MGNTQLDQERAEFEDGSWYWVEKEGWHDEPPDIAPAMYRANSRAWYSYRFGGIPTRDLKILEPCLMQASRRAQVVPQYCDLCKDEGGYFYGRTGYEPCCVGSEAPHPPEAERHVFIRKGGSVGKTEAMPLICTLRESAAIDVLERDGVISAMDACNLRINLVRMASSATHQLPEADHIPDAGEMVAKQGINHIKN